MVGRGDPRVHVFGASEYAGRAADWIAERMRRAASYRGRFALALAGGEVAPPVYEALARTRGLPWRKAEVFFSDERAGSPDGGGRNLRMARERLLDRVLVPADRIHPLAADAEDREAEARRYAERLPDRLDLVLLDLGEDGRIGALLPGETAPDPERRVVAPGTPGEGPGRLGLGPAALWSARTVAVLARGEAVAAAVVAALATEGSPAECPARVVRDGSWLLDPGAATGLQRRSG